MTVDLFIEAEKQAGHNVKRACELMKVSRSAYYSRRSGAPGTRALRDAELTALINEVHTHSRGTYGAPRIHAVLARQGHACGRRRIARLMREAGVVGRHRRRGHRTTVPDPGAATRPDLVMRDFSADPHAVDTRWCGDITYIATGQGWLYLATVIDIASRRVIGWATADHLGTPLVADALQAACHQRGPGGPVVFHSDRGSQYTSHAFARLAADHNIRLSVGRTGVCWDNALAEPFFATLKNELVSQHTWHTKTAARTAIFEYIEGWVQHPPTPQQPRLPKPSRVRNDRSPTNTTHLSAKQEQPHPDGTPVFLDSGMRPVEPFCSWFRHLAHESRGPDTMRSYAYVVSRLVDFLAARGTDVVGATKTDLAA
ncbi:IS3 family transposase [Streptomyces sp. NPDC048258]|uniref:IS3 family transposase n=1 Tax=Streptomyces sp. NPDC048258 TaxID=3365527 RepID=UPI003719D2C8